MVLMKHHRPSRAARLIAALALPFALAACGGNVIVEDPPETTTGTATGPTCGSSLTLCDGHCVDLSSDPLNCGACNESCFGAECQAGTCQTGTTIACPSGATQCGDGCYYLASDHENCGTCGYSCFDDEECIGGTCSSGSCVTCAEFITPGSSPDGAPLCEGLSQELYEVLVECVCNGQCLPQCGDNACAGADLTPECQDCVTDTVNGCGNEFSECANDL
jgi:hypothetical protein